jgi:hypothetical protein
MVGYQKNIDPFKIKKSFMQEHNNAKKQMEEFFWLYKG